jgi:hypothetical protein
MLGSLIPMTRSMHLHPPLGGTNMKCPKCQNKFHPLRVVLITRWSSLICPECQSRLNRRIDLQLCLVSMVPIIAMLLGVLLPIAFQIKVFVILTLVVITVFLMSFVDAATIRLVSAEKQNGWRKILGDKLETSGNRRVS